MSMDHPFNRKPGQPPYWLRNDALELELHVRLRTEHEIFHGIHGLPKKEPKKEDKP